jgi:hypothetical protein
MELSENLKDRLGFSVEDWPMKASCSHASSAGGAIFWQKSISGGRNGQQDCQIFLGP